MKARALPPIAVFLWAATLVACAPNYADAPADVVAGGVEVIRTSFDSKTKYVGPRLRDTEFAGLFNGYDYKDFRLRGWRDDQINLTTHQLYIEIDYTERSWRFYYSANAEGGQSLGLTQINQEVRRCHVYQYFGSLCDFRETLGVPIDHQFLIEKQNTGFSVRINARSGDSNIFVVPARYIQGYLWRAL